MVCVPDVEQKLPETPGTCTSALPTGDFRPLTHALCYGLNVCIAPLNSYVGILNPSVMVSGGGALGRQLGHEGGAPMNGIRALTKDTPESCLSPV